MWCIPLFFILAIANGKQEFKKLYSWENLTFECNDNKKCNEFLEDENEFIVKNNVIDGIAVWKDKMFITVGRWKKGVASNLNYVKISDEDSANGNESPKLIPYPSWEHNNLENDLNDEIIDMIHIKVDSNNRLWGLDNGITSLVDEKRLLPPRLIAIDLKSNKITVNYKLNPADVKKDSLFSNLVIDDQEGDSKNVYVYILDPIEGGLVVYDHKNQESWRVEHESLKHNSEKDAFDVCEGMYPLKTGINDGFVLRNKLGSKFLYFHALSSTTEYKIATEVLQNKKLALKANEEFSEVGSKGENSQGPTSALDAETGLAYFTLYKQNGIAFWDTSETLSKKTFRLILSEKDKERPDMKKKDLTISRGNIYVLTGNVGEIPCDENYNPNHYIAYASLENLPKLSKPNDQ